MNAHRPTHRGASLVAVVAVVAVAVVAAGAGYWYGTRHAPPTADVATGAIATAPAAPTATTTMATTATRLAPRCVGRRAFMRPP